MKLYHHPISSYSQKVLIAFHEKNVKFEPVLVDLMNPAAREEYKKVNPHGVVPTLVLGDGWKVPESSIIIEWLENNHATGTRLIPEDKNLARQVRFFDRISDLYLNNPMQTIFFDGLKPEGDREPKRVAKAKETVLTSLGLMDQHFAKKGPWTMGDSFTMADCAAAPALFYLRGMVPYADTHKHVEAYWNRLTERPSVKHAIGLAMPYITAMQGKK